MASENWKEVLKSQHADLERLEAMDAALNENAISDDIDRILRRPNAAPTSKYSVPAAGGNSGHSSGATSPPKPPVRRSSLSDTHNSSSSNMHEVYTESGSGIGTSPKVQHGADNPMSSQSSPPPSAETPLAPETADRMVKAKLKVMQKQVTDAVEFRKKVEEQAKDLQRQLKDERDANKSLRSRISTLESELKKSSKRQSDFSYAQGSAEALQQEVYVLRKDLETAQRLVKQGETAAKTKDGQIKRAAETIAKLKEQLKDLQLQKDHDVSGEKARTSDLENRIRTLEKQRGELIEGFRKQLKLIDILKRQKVHIEAARLLSFTEEEFMKTLDWKI